MKGIIRKKSLMGLICALVLSFISFKTFSQDKATRLGLHFTKEEVEIWKQRATSGPFKSKGDYKPNSPGDWDRIMSQANSFLSNPGAERWRGDGNTSSCIPQWSSEPHHNGVKLRDAAFVYLVTGNQKYFDPVRKELLAQASESMTDFSNRNRWCLGSGKLGDINPSFAISEWLHRLLYAYDYVKHSMTDSERQKMEKWFRDAAYYFLGNVEGDISGLWVDRLNDNYTPTAVQNQSSSKYTHYQGYNVTKGSVYYNNRRTNQMSFVGQAAVLLNDETLKSRAKRFVKEFIKYAMFPDGTLSDMYRGQSSSRNKGLDYVFNQLSHMTQMADAFARAGDMELYEYTTSEGIKNTAGGPKSLLLAIKRTIKYMDKSNKPYRYVTSSSSTLISGEADWVHDTWFAQENMYYRDDYVKGSYTRSNSNINNASFPSRAQTVGPWHPWSGSGNTVPGKMFMFGDMEGKAWPFDADPGAGFNAAPVVAPIEDQGMNVGQELKVQVSATDKEKDAITLSAANLPAFASFNDAGNGSGTFTFKPVAGNYGDYEISVTATDSNKKTSTLSFKLFVNDPAVCVPVKASTAQDPNVAANVLDGDLSTRWSAEGKGQWIQFDLCENQSVDHIDIAFLNGDSRKSYFEVMTSTDGMTWASALKGTSSGTTADMETFNFAAKNARYVRLVGNGNSSNEWNSILEVKILDTNDSGSGTESPSEPGTPTDSTNTTPEAPAECAVGATASSFQDPNSPANAFDGDLATRWSAEGVGEWLQYNFCETKTINSVDISNMSGDRRKAYFAVAVSMDGTNWTEVFKGESSGTTSELENYTFEAVEAKYVRIIGNGNSMDGSNWNSIQEVKFNEVATETPTDPEVCAVGATASSFQDPNTPANAFDGDLSTRWSADGVGEWLQYNFCEKTTINSVDISYMSGDKRKAYFAVAVSMDGNHWVEVYNGESSGTTSELENYTFEAVEAKYVRIIGNGNSMDGSNWNSIQEVKFNEVATETPTDPSENLTPMLSLIYQVKEGETAEIVLEPVDEDGDTVKKEITGLPGFAKMEELTDGSTKITLAPVAGDQGEHKVYVTVSDDKGAISTTLLVVNVEGDQALKTASTDNNQLSVYPNPVDDYVIVDFKTEMMGDVTLAFFDELGNQLATDAVSLDNESQVRLDVTKYNLESGIVHLKINSGSIDQTFRLWKN